MIPPDEFDDLVALSRHSRDQRRGGNSIVTRMEWRGRQVVIKDYNARTDAATRLRREWNGLLLLRSLDIRLAPEPLGADFEAGIGVQEWLPGVPPSMGAATTAAMGTVLGQLHEGAGRLQVESSAQPAADSIQDIAQMRAQVLQRFGQLKRLGLPALEDLLDQLTDGAHAVEACDDEVGRWIPTLSPSDFGPHNLLRDAASDTWSLIDLEFFGWDDAHKLVCDTLLHPLIAWEGDLVGEFVDTSTQTYCLDPERLAALFPWCSLKWATIVAHRAARETCAGRLEQAHEAIAKAQTYVLRAVESTCLRRDPSGLGAIVRWEPPW